jgi:hypothetical protein
MRDSVFVSETGRRHWPSKWTGLIQIAKETDIDRRQRKWNSNLYMKQTVTI